MGWVDFIPKNSTFDNNKYITNIFMLVKKIITYLPIIVCIHLISFTLCYAQFSPITKSNKAYFRGELKKDLFLTPFTTNKKHLDKNHRTISNKQLNGYDYYSYSTQTNSYIKRWDGDIHYTAPYTIDYYGILNNTDTLQKEHGTLINGYTLNQIVGYFLPTYSYNAALLDYKSESYFIYEAMERQDKIHGKWNRTRALNGLVHKSWGSKYKEVYSGSYDSRACPDKLTMEQTVTGESIGEGWHSELNLVIYNNCSEIPQNSFNVFFTYDDAGNKIEELEEGSVRLTYEYDGQKRNTKSLQQIWVNDMWENDERLTFTYDDTKPYTMYSKETWQGGVWVGKYRTTNYQVYTNSEGNTVHQYQSERWDNQAWVPSLRYTITLKGNSLDTLLSELNERWNATTMQWETSGYVKRDFNSATQMTFEYVDAIFGPEDAFGTKIVYYFDINGNHIQSNSYGCKGLACNPAGESIWTPEFWVEVGGHDNETLDYWKTYLWQVNENKWSEYDSIANVYDAEGDPLELFYEAYDSDTILGGEKYHFNYGMATTSSNQQWKNDYVTIFPNPTKGEINIRANYSEPATIGVYDVWGRIIKQFSCSNLSSFVIDMSTDPSGTYYLKISNEKNQLVKPITLIH